MSDAMKRLTDKESKKMNPKMIEHLIVAAKQFERLRGILNEFSAYVGEIEIDPDKKKIIQLYITRAAEVFFDVKEIENE